MLRHFSALIPGQRTAQVLRQFDDGPRDGVADSLSAMPCERGAVLHTSVTAVAFHARQMKKERETRCPLHQRANGRTAQS